MCVCVCLFLIVACVPVHILLEHRNGLRAIAITNGLRESNFHLSESLQIFFKCVQHNIQTVYLLTDLLGYIAISQTFQQIISLFISSSSFSSSLIFIFVFEISRIQNI
jgi:hypothetical protein